MSNPANDNKKQKNISFSNSKDSGSEYHREHAGHVEGYGETYPTAKNMSNTNDQ
ncbi:hypothetical protein [Bacillus sp. FJAT-29937]|uniref:hypothetical protein n=1 Tax=Bacillus sp. FJAT-29937 TaxID=1720553 RepID=UPI000AAC9ADC|nr:hypothetical protein [Bacillus sp. FJAT-29937]